MTDYAWTDDARCIGLPDYIFFPPPGRHPATAQQVCAECPVRLQCLTLALEAEVGLSHRSRFGVFGGLDPVERAKLSRGMAA